MTQIGQITKSTLENMLGKAVEGSHLEFKEDIPVHRQRADEQMRAGTARPVDEWWNGKQSIADHGRNELLEEIVAFANGQGGQLFLGMEEASDGAPVAKAIRPLPRVAELEPKFRDYLLDQVEPRLPYSAVKAIQTADDGSGVLVIEVEASRLGPHWVKATRRATIRRSDKCLPMTMMEIQDMTLRNARRFDEVRSVLDARIGTFAQDFLGWLASKVDIDILGGTPQSRVQVWLKQKNLSAVAYRIVLVAHEDLGLSRLTSFNGIVPSEMSVGRGPANAVTASKDMVAIWPSVEQGRRFLGGISQGGDWGPGSYEFVVKREGVVEASFFLYSDSQSGSLLTVDHLAGAVGCAFGMYDNLRRMSGRTSVPVEVALAVETRGSVHVVSGNQQMAKLFGGSLPPRSDFPRRTAADAEEFSALMTETAQDLLDAANSGHHGSSGPQFRYLPRVEGI